ncbi:unnamed protein product [marine sediment metagenome]|uniref:Uncharacterized protein n=1 Tax=marine sediment metagenome TaxID=412755 RepID=X1UZJ4_9ZZZZ
MYIWTDDTWWLEWGSLLGRGIEVKVRETAATELEITFSGITPEHSKSDIEKLAKFMQKEREYLLSNQGKRIQNRPMRRLPEYFEWYRQWLLQDRKGYAKIIEEWNNHQGRHKGCGRARKVPSSALGRRKAPG